jgi:hypothetical protein
MLGSGVPRIDVAPVYLRGSRQSRATVQEPG